MESRQRWEQIRRNEHRRKKAKQRLLIASAFVLVVGIIFGSILGGAIGKGPLKKEVKALTEKLQEAEKAAVETAKQSEKHENLEDAELPWNLVLVNKWNEMEEGYVPELTEVAEGYEVDSRIADAVKEMLSDAKEAGLNPIICSAYRSLDKQEELFDDNMKEKVRNGMGYYDAYMEASTMVAVPGTSEHALGLAVDIVSIDNQMLDESQEETAEAKWLIENCHKYGFILRYPNGTTDITGIIYEPWHYRYVGVEIATEITELGVTFEEYLEEHYEP
ncbi:MAG: M15 family metallopeptidase [Tyzzerella sp.]|nr:M15 family metallopeptidase [Tyzzerella sp.]